jgi:hypothetical protein
VLQGSKGLSLATRGSTTTTRAVVELRTSLMVDSGVLDRVVTRQWIYQAWISTFIPDYLERGDSDVKSMIGGGCLCDDEEYQILTFEFESPEDDHTACTVSGGTSMILQ